MDAAPTRHRRSLGAVALVLLVVAAGLLLWLRPWVDRAQAGTLLEASSEPGRQVTVLVPDGEVTVRVGVPTTEPEPARLQDAPMLERGDALWPVTLMTRKAGKASVVLDVGGARTELDQGRGADDGVTRSWYVVAPSDADRVRVEVGFDGLTQTADLATGHVDSGVAAGLYEREGGITPECRVTLRGLPADTSYVSGANGCRAYGLLTYTPYDPELGWVDDPDERWASVQPPYVDDPGFITRGDREDLLTARAAGPARLRIDGAEPVTTRFIGEGDRVRTRVFRLDAFPHRLTSVRTFRVDGVRVTSHLDARFERVAR